MSVSASRVTVTDAATILASGDSADGLSVAVHNPGATTVFIGGADVTASNGFELGAEQTIAIDLAPPRGPVSGEWGAGESLYGVVASGTQEVQVLKTKVG
jgi:hypothetical protein